MKSSVLSDVSVCLYDQQGEGWIIAHTGGWGRSPCVTAAKGGFIIQHSLNCFLLNWFIIRKSSSLLSNISVAVSLR